MDKIQNRSNRIQAYYFSKRLDEIKALETKGIDVINLGIGSPDIEPDKLVRNAMQKAMTEAGSFRYQPYQGLEKLRVSMASWYTRVYQVKLNPDTEILPLSGSKSGIGYLSLAWLKPGDKVLVPNPGYASYTSSAEIAGAVAIPYNLKEENDWYPDLEELEELVDANCKMIWLNYPHMPTGQKASRKVFEAMLDFAERNQLLLCHDNPYSLTLNKKPESILQYAKTGQTVLELNSLSKSHNMAGARLGMLVGDQRLIDTVGNIQSHFDSGIFRPVQESGAFALDLSEAWYERQNKAYTKRRGIVHSILDQLGCTYNRESVGMFVWAKIPPTFCHGRELSDWLLDELAVFVVPGSVFGTNGEKYIRISLCAPEDRLNEALERLGSRQNKLEERTENHEKYYNIYR